LVDAVEETKEIDEEVEGDDRTAAEGEVADVDVEEEEEVEDEDKVLTNSAISAKNVAYELKS